MKRTWEHTYGQLGDVSGCLREAMDTLRSVLPHCAPPADDRGFSSSPDIREQLQEKAKRMQELHAEIEQLRRTYYISHSPAPAIRATPLAFPFKAQEAT